MKRMTARPKKTTTQRSLARTCEKQPKLDLLTHGRVTIAATVIGTLSMRGLVNGGMCVDTGGGRCALHGALRMQRGQRLVEEAGSSTI